MGRLQPYKYPRATILFGVAALCALGFSFALWNANEAAPTQASGVMRERSTVDDEPDRSRKTVADNTARPGEEILEAASKSSPQGDALRALLKGTSLEGTDIDGDLPVDERGHLVPGPEVLAMFDYFLSLRGELTDELVRDLIVEAIERRLDDPARAEAESLLDDYLRYRRRGRALSGGIDESQSTADRLETIHALREEVFGEQTAAALFGEQERTARVDLKLREVMADESLDADQRAERIKKIEDELPESEREARARSRLPLRSMRDEEMMREQGASAEEIRSLRVERFGDEGADRLAELDRRRAAWTRKLEAWKSERARLQSRPESERAAALQAWERANLSPGQRRRVHALATLEDRQARQAR